MRLFGMAVVGLTLGLSPVWAGDAPATGSKKSAEESTKKKKKKKKKKRYTGGCYTDAPRFDRGGEIAWRQDIEQAFRAARRAQRPILLYFTADW